MAGRMPVREHVGADRDSVGREVLETIRSSSLRSARQEKAGAALRQFLDDLTRERPALRGSAITRLGASPP